MNFFDIVAPAYEIFHPGAQKSFRRLQQLGHFQKTDRVLDLGGGKGRVSKFFNGQVQKIVVVDSSSGMIKRCQNHLGLSCILAQAEKLPFKDNYFDKVIIVEAFHHFQDQEKVCQEIQRILKPGGLVVVEEINPDKFSGWCFGKIENILLGLRSRFYSPESLSWFFERHQFKVTLTSNPQTTYYLVAQKP